MNDAWNEQHHTKPPPAVAVPAAADAVERHARDRLAALRLLLTGESVVDGGAVWFTTRPDVDAFLKLSGFDCKQEVDMARLWEIHHDAVSYLTDVQRFQLPPEVERPREVQDLFLAAGDASSPLRAAACMVLKVMHIQYHIMGRELLFNIPISEAQLFERLRAKMFAVIDRMRQAGVTVHEFAAGTKKRTSLATKLLAKRSSLASQIFDRVRFRIVVGDKRDVVRALLHLTEQLFPVNYVVPEQSKNAVLTAQDIAQALAVPVEMVRAYIPEQTSDASPCEPNPPNEFSGRTYRTVNFVVDSPLRIDDLVPEHTPATVFVQSEIQVIDVETARHNEEGENAHQRYKERQRERVRARLLQGL